MSSLSCFFFFVFSAKCIGYKVFTVSQIQETEEFKFEMCVQCIYEIFKNDFQIIPLCCMYLEKK